MKLEVLDNKGAKIEDITLAKEVFEVEENKGLIAQCVHIYKTNQRQGNSSVLTRAEVSGGGRKPWRQKGTGRARHGSTRSPIWVHGGIAHGPKPKDYLKKLPKKMKKQAMRVVLSALVRDGRVKVIDNIKMSKPNTKEMAKLLEKLKMDRKTLIVTDKANQTIVNSAANLPGVVVAAQDSVNIYQLISTKQALFEKDAIKSLAKKYK